MGIISMSTPYNPTYMNSMLQVVTLVNVVCLDCSVKNMSTIILNRGIPILNYTKTDKPALCSFYSSLSFTYLLYVTSVYKSGPNMAHGFSISQLRKSETRMDWIHAGWDCLERYIPFSKRHQNDINNRLKSKHSFMHLFRFEIYWKIYWIYLFQQ